LSFGSRFDYERELKAGAPLIRRKPHAVWEKDKNGDAERLLGEKKSVVKGKAQVGRFCKNFGGKGRPRCGATDQGS